MKKPGKKFFSYLETTFGKVKLLTAMLFLGHFLSEDCLKCPQIREIY